MDNYKLVITTVSGLLGAGLVVGAIVLRSGQEPARPAPSSNKAAVQSLAVISKQTLAAADGRAGRVCYVAIDGTVYEIRNSPRWINGQHTTSEGQASCGRDLSQVINKSPHGRKILETLIIVGRLAQ